MVVTWCMFSVSFISVWADITSSLVSLSVHIDNVNETMCREIQNSGFLPALTAVAKQLLSRRGI